MPAPTIGPDLRERLGFECGCQPASVGILGGGALGLAAALRLAEGGCTVTLLEREPQLGGLAAGFKVGPSTLEKFYHHIFKTDRTIIRFIREMDLASNLEWSRPNTSVLQSGRIYSLGSIGALLRLRLLPFPARLRFIASMALLKVTPDERVFRGRRAAPWMKRLMGRRIFDIMWEPMLRGKFGARADDIAMSWLWSRVHERSLSLGYLCGGFQRLYDALGERIRALGGSVLLGTTVTAIRTGKQGPVVQTEDGAEFQFDRLLVTLPTRAFTRLAPDLPEAWVKRYPGPDHYGAQVAIVGLDREFLNGVYWLNINDRDLPFLALVEHTNFRSIVEYGGLHLLYLGNYLPMDHPLFRESDDTVRASIEQALLRIRPDFDRSWIKSFWIFKAPYAQPIVTVNYVDDLPPHRTPIRGVFLANMAHVYPQDRGQNYSLELGERMARTILHDVHPGRPATVGSDRGAGGGGPLGCDTRGLTMA
jgi:protoporphyrinogen oxidase